jgi:hypothetical protein
MSHTGWPPFMTKALQKNPAGVLLACFDNLLFLGLILPFNYERKMNISGYS